MLTLKDRKLVCLSTSNNSVRQALIELWQKGVDCRMTTNVEECVQLIAEQKPDFIFLSLEHPRFDRVLSLARVIEKNLSSQVVGFVENDSTAHLSRLSQSQLTYRIAPPFLGKKCLKTIDKILKDHPEKFYKTETFRPKPQKPTVISPNNHEVNSLEALTQHSLDQICKSSDSPNSYEVIEKTKTVIAAPFQSGNVSGYFIGGWGGHPKIKDIKFLFSEIIDFTIFWAQSKGIDINVLQANIYNIPQIDFYKWSLTDARFCKTVFHEGREVAIALFEKNHSIDNLNTESIENDLVTIIEDYGFTQINKELSDSLRIKKDQERLRAEVKGAQGVQDYLFPSSHHLDEDLELRGFMERASECGGDWWYYNTNERMAYFWIGDATGHGMPAALVTAAARSAASILRELPDLSLPQLMSILNSSIFGAGGGEVLMTFFLSRLNLDTGELFYCNASHDFPMVFPNTPNPIKKSEIKFLSKSSGPRLGEKPGTKYTQHSTIISPGERLVFFTDGLTELQNNSGQLWGERRFIKSLLTSFNKYSGVTGPMQTVARNLEEFRKGHPYEDDVTYFFLQFKPRSRIVKMGA